MKGAFAEVNACLPEAAFAGTLQNMQRTVTVVERYQKIFDIALIFCFDMQPCCISELIFLEVF